MLGYWDFVEGLSRGFAAHHAGMLPTFREIVEELFTAGRIRAVFATETLALGINMPARTVVLEKLVKFNGETHVDITPAEYTQLTGRAGRRGIDIEGHAVVLWNRGLDPLAVGGPRVDAHLPAALELPADLQHGRQPRRPGRPRGGPRDPRDLVRPVPGRPGRRRHRAGTVRRNEEALEGYAEAMHCHLGDFTRVRRAPQRDPPTLEKEGVKAALGQPPRRGRGLSLEELRIGDVIRIPAGRRAGYAVVVQPNRGGKGEPAVAGRRHRGQAAAPAHPGRRARRRSSRHARQGAAALQRQEPQVAPRPGHDAADRRAARAAAQPAGREAAAGDEAERIERAAPPDARRTRATSAPTARTTPAGPSGGGGSSARPTACSARSRAAPTRWPAPSTGSATCSARWATSPTAAPTVTAAGRDGCAGSTPRRTCSPPSACATACGSASTPPGSPPPSRRSSTSRAARRPRSPRGCPTTTSPRRYTEMIRLWSRARGPRARPRRCRSPAMPDGGHGLDGAPLGERAAARGRAARAATWPPVTSCAGASRSSTCSTRSADAAPTAEPCAATARTAVDAVLRGVVAADRLD